MKPSYAEDVWASWEQSSLTLQRIHLPESYGVKKICIYVEWVGLQSMSSYTGREKGLEHSSKVSSMWKRMELWRLHQFRNSEKVCFPFENMRVGGHWWCLLLEEVLWGQNLGLQSSSCRTTEVFPFLPERWGLFFNNEDDILAAT